MASDSHVFRGAQAVHNVDHSSFRQSVHASKANEKYKRNVAKKLTCCCLQHTTFPILKKKKQYVLLTYSKRTIIVIVNYTTQHSKVDYDHILQSLLRQLLLRLIRPRWFIRTVNYDGLLRMSGMRLFVPARCIIMFRLYCCNSRDQRNSF